MASAAGVALSEACETQSGDETQAHETPHADAEETQGEETHVQAEAREMRTEVPAEETQAQISNNVASQIDDVIVEETQLQIPSPVTPVSLIPSPSVLVSLKRKAVDEQVSPWKSRKSQTEDPAEETQAQSSNNVASQIDDAIVEKTQLQIPSPVTPVSLISLPSTPDSRKRNAVDEQVSPWKSRKLISSPQIQVT